MPPLHYILDMTFEGKCLIEGATLARYGIVEGMRSARFPCRCVRPQPNAMVRRCCRVIIRCDSSYGRTAACTGHPRASAAALRGHAN